MLDIRKLVLLMRKQGGEGGTFGLQNTESYGQNEGCGQSDGCGQNEDVGRVRGGSVRLLFNFPEAGRWVWVHRSRYKGKSSSCFRRE